MSRQCTKCNKDFIHVTRHEYECPKCNRNICIECIEHHCNEGTGHIYCPLCNNIWKEYEYTYYFAPLQCRLLLKLSQKIRGCDISGCTNIISGKKRGRTGSFDNESPPTKKPYINTAILHPITNIVDYCMTDCSGNLLNISVIPYYNEDDANVDVDADSNTDEESNQDEESGDEDEESGDDNEESGDEDEESGDEESGDEESGDDNEDDEENLSEQDKANIQEIVRNLFGGHNISQPPIVFRQQAIPITIRHIHNINSNDNEENQTSKELTILKELTEKDVQYFNTLSVTEKKEIESRYKDIQDASRTDNKTPLIIKILRNKSMPIKVQEQALEMIKTLRGGCGGETSSKTQEWLRGLLKIPFGVTKSLPTYIDRANKESCSTFLENARRQLDKTIYGMETVKMQIIQMMGLWIVNPKAASQPIGLCGPAGVGKTSILRNGIAAILDRPFAMIPLGGLSDARMLKGFELTYVGSQCGRIVRVLQETQVMNPVILFDEVDKISTKNGTDEVSATLIHVTDRTSNTDYQDIYFNGVPIDISGALMAFSMNDLQAVNPILRNRMHVIHVPAYKKKEKLAILQQYILPRVEEEYGFHYDFSKDTLTWFIEQFDGGEGGVRMLIHATEKLYSRLNIGRMNPALLEKVAIKDYLNITKDDIQKIMNIYDDEKSTEANEWWKQLYV